MAIIEIPASVDNRFKSWRKHIKKIDKSHQDGYAFCGEFLVCDRKCTRKAELPVGELVLIYDEVGSVKRHEPEVSVHRVAANGLSEPLVTATGASWALDIRDDVASLLGEQLNPLADYSDAELTAELRRRHV